MRPWVAFPAWAATSLRRRLALGLRVGERELHLGVVDARYGRRGVSAAGSRLAPNPRQHSGRRRRREAVAADHGSSRSCALGGACILRRRQRALPGSRVVVARYL